MAGGSDASQPAKPRHRRQRHEGAQVRHRVLQILRHLLDQEGAEGDAGQALVAIGDRIEHRRLGVLRRQRRALRVEHRGDRGRDLRRQRHLDEDQRIVRDRGVEEGEAAPVRRGKPLAQLVPVADGVDRFVADDLFQDARRGVPVDRPQQQEAAIEPGLEQMAEIGVDRAVALAVGLEQRQQALAQRDQFGGAARREVQATEQLLARRLGVVLEPRQGLGVGRLEKCCGRIGQRLLIRRELIRQHLEEALRVGVAQAAEAAQDLGRQAHAGGFAARGDRARGRAPPAGRRRSSGWRCRRETRTVRRSNPAGRTEGRRGS